MLTQTKQRTATVVENGQEDQGYKMKKFDQVIHIAVPVSGIAKDLLSKLGPDFKHKEMVAEAIIGYGVNNPELLSYVFNALNGYTPEINFKVGDVIMCSSTVYYTAIGDNKPQSHKIGKAEVVEIDLYRSEKLKIKYTLNREGDAEQENWMSHDKCERIAPVEEEIVDAQLT